MILDLGNKILVVHRRLFEKDKPRYFIGTVEACEEGLARGSGYSWAEDPFTGKMVRKNGIRTKIIALQSLGVIVYVLPQYVVPANLHFFLEAGKLLLQDPENQFEMDLSEMMHAKGS